MTTRELISELYEAGVPQPEIARALGLAPTTVSYHVERLQLRVPAAAETPPSESALVRSNTHEIVAALLAEGLTRVEIARRLGLSKSTVTYHARRLGADVNERYANRYDWDAIRRYYDAGHSVRDCMRAFGFCSASWSDAVKRGKVVGRPSAAPISDLLVAGTYRGRTHLKLRLISEGLKDGSCERCGLIEWAGKPISMALHHINGDRLDNRLENLELLCPNCHSQTDTYSGRNGHRRRAHLALVPPGSVVGDAQIDARSVDVSASSSTDAPTSA